MPDYRKIAKQYIDNGLWVIPVTSEKQPAVKNWTELQVRPMDTEEINKSFKKCFGIALLCGGKNKVELLDWDLKYDLSGDFYDRVKKEIPDSIKRKMFVQSSKNNGFHWIYKISEERVFPNQKLASRYTTAFEKHKRYLEYFQDPKTRDKAMKIALRDDNRVLAETRGGTAERCGGYGLISPTEGYKVIYKPEGGLQTLTNEEHELLLDTVRSFNEVTNLDSSSNKKYDNFSWDVTPFEDYNERGDVLGILYDSGWENINETSKSVRLKRPGATSGSSGLFDLDSRIFSCFSTSTRFDTNKSYNPTGVFIELEHDGDGSAAYKNLIELGFGIKK